MYLKKTCATGKHIPNGKTCAGGKHVPREKAVREHVPWYIL
jgi:hypothetical protein